MSTSGQNSLLNFYNSVKFQNPVLAEEMSYDISLVGLWGLSANKSEGQLAADRLREKAQILPEVHRRVLDNTLTILGYS